MSDSIRQATGGGHELLNPFGEVIRVSKITLRMLDMKNLLQRDPATGLKQIKPNRALLILQMEKNTFHRELYAALGPSFDGPNQVSCPCRECSNKISDLDHTRLSEEYGRQVVRSIQRGRAA